jgi:hypothetical protein
MSTHTKPKGKSRKSLAHSTTVYLIHFNKAYRHARHYIGFTTNLDKRITDHLCGMGARLMEVITDAGIEWRVSRIWVGDRRFERRLKNRHNAPALCPVCVGKRAMKRGNYRKENRSMERLTITRRTQESGHVVVMIEIRGRIYAATYAPGSDVSDKAVKDDLKCHGYGKRNRKGFRPYDQSRGRYL